jgi:hypothetical protein
LPTTDHDRDLELALAHCADLGGQPFQECRIDAVVGSPINASPDSLTRMRRWRAVPS